MTTLHSSPQEAMQAPPEEFLYVACLHEGTGVERGLLAVVDAEDGRIIHETPMPNVGDELHHYGWNRCSSACHGPDRSHLIMPGFRSSRIHILNVADDPRRPTIEKVIEPEEIVAKTGLTRPHTVHCMPGDNVVMSMLGDADGNAAGGFAVLDSKTFEIKGRWENGGPHPPMNYDFWYQPRENTLVSPSSGSRTRSSPASTSPTSRPAATASGSTSGTSRSARSSRRSTWASTARSAGDPRPARAECEGRVRRRRAVEQHLALRTRQRLVVGQARDHDRPGRARGWPLAGRRSSPTSSSRWTTARALLLRLAPRRPATLRSRPGEPAADREALARRGLLGKPSDAGRELNGGPQMLQLSLDGKRLYVTNSLYSTWDNQFYPELRSWLQGRHREDGSMEVDRDFFVDFHDRPGGPARTVRLQGGDCTTEIFQ